MLYNLNSNIFHLGIDDTDSNEGLCTTYLGTQIVNLLLDYQVLFLDFPLLIRLNPNIPFKTRGNGAIAFRFILDQSRVDSLWSDLIKIIEEFSDIKAAETHPGMVLIKGEIPTFMKNLYSKALNELISLEDVKKELKEDNNIRLFFLKKGRGLIGASAAIGSTLDQDYTFELIAYRIKDNWGDKKRLIDKKTVFTADREEPLTISNIDNDHGDIMILPHGPDPVYCGIRGETVKSVVNMWRSLKVFEPIETLMIYRTNQHTRVHFLTDSDSNNIHPFQSIISKGEVIESPRYIEGAHVIFSLKIDENIIDCAAYEPTKKFRNQVMGLHKGDILQVCGGIRAHEQGKNLTLNLEEFTVLYLKTEFKYLTPKCPHCNITLKSAGKNSGFKCKRCSFTAHKKYYIKLQTPRVLKPNVRYVSPVCAQRHLTKPIDREVSLQFHSFNETSFSEQFDDFLNIREDILRNIINHKEN
ncbi:TiaS agmantine-binding domain-containing protein [Candidatus Hodarchaeum mangrovi]